MSQQNGTLSRNLSDDRHQQWLLAGFYGLYLREQGYPREEAAKLVILRYPATRPVLERLTRRVVDPLQPQEEPVVKEPFTGIPTVGETPRGSH
jgi:hypothetical protein